MVTLAGDIDLTGTGILGIGKDNIEKGTNAQIFHWNTERKQSYDYFGYRDDMYGAKCFKVQEIMQQVSFMQREVMRGMHIIVWR